MDGSNKDTYSHMKLFPDEFQDVLNGLSEEFEIGGAGNTVVGSRKVSGNPFAVLSVEFLLEKVGLVG